MVGLEIGLAVIAGGVALLAAADLYLEDAPADDDPEAGRTADVSPEALVALFEGDAEEGGDAAPPAIVAAHGGETGGTVYELRAGGTPVDLDLSRDVAPWLLATDALGAPLGPDADMAFRKVAGGVVLLIGGTAVARVTGLPPGTALDPATLLANHDPDVLARVALAKGARDEALDLGPAAAEVEVQADGGAALPPVVLSRFAAEGPLADTLVLTDATGAPLAPARLQPGGDLPLILATASASGGWALFAGGAEVLRVPGADPPPRDALWSRIANLRPEPEAPGAH